MGRKMWMQFFTGQAWWGEEGLGCLVPWTGVPNVSITDGAPLQRWSKYPAVSQLFRCRPNYRWYVAHLHLHEHERPPFASQQPTIYFPTKIRLTTLSKATFYSSYIILFSFVRKGWQEDMYVIHIVYESLHFWACALEVITFKKQLPSEYSQPRYIGDIFQNAVNF